MYSLYGVEHRGFHLLSQNSVQSQYLGGEEGIHLGVPHLIFGIDKTLKVKIDSFCLTLQGEVALIPNLRCNPRSNYTRKSPLHEGGVVPSAVTLHGKRYI